MSLKTLLLPILLHAFVKKVVVNCLIYYFPYLDQYSELQAKFFGSYEF